MGLLPWPLLRPCSCICEVMLCPGQLFVTDWAGESPAAREGRAVTCNLRAALLLQLCSPRAAPCAEVGVADVHPAFGPV